MTKKTLYGLLVFVSRTVVFCFLSVLGPLRLCVEASASGLEILVVCQMVRRTI